VVADQGDQSCQGGCVSVPANRYVQTATRIYSAPASVDLVDRVLDLAYAFSPFEYRAYKLASFARGVLGSDTSVAFCFPSGWQPRYLVSAVVRSDRCVVGAWEGLSNSIPKAISFAFIVLFLCGSRCVLRRVFCVAMTHMSHAFRGTSSRFLHVFPVILHVFWEATGAPTLRHRRVQTCSA
jgi:hypothetical protein